MVGCARVQVQQQPHHRHLAEGNCQHKRRRTIRFSFSIAAKRTEHANCVHIARNCSRMKHCVPEKKKPLVSTRASTQARRKKHPSPILVDVAQVRALKEQKFHKVIEFRKSGTDTTHQRCRTERNQRFVRKQKPTHKKSNTQMNHVHQSQHHNRAITAERRDSSTKLQRGAASSNFSRRSSPSFLRRCSRRWRANVALG